MKKTISSLFVLIFCSIGISAQFKTIRNGDLWRDDKGKIVQAHAAGFLQVGDTWYMVGEDRTNTWRPDVNMYSSKDLVNWKFERKIIQNGVTHPSLGGDRMIERAKLLYNEKTNKFVVWCHWEAGNYGASEAAVFYCDSVNGPYKFHWAGRPLGIKSRDCNIFVDDDGTAYFISTTEENQHLGLFKLSDDYLSVINHTQLFPWQQREAPAIIKKDGLYYMISSACTGWDSNQAKIATSNSLSSGWSGLRDIGNANSFDTQAASILEINGTEGTTYIYVGDRWMDPNLFESKTIMFPVQISNGNMTFNYTRQWDLDIDKGIWRVTPINNNVQKTNWKLHYVSSQETSGENGGAINSFDNNFNTIWHTKWQGGTDPHPHDLQIDMGSEHMLTGFIATPRQSKETNGVIRNFLFYTSIDGVDWGSPVAGGWMTWESEISFAPKLARYIRLVAYSEFSGKNFASLAEIDVFKNTTYSAVTIQPNIKINNLSWQAKTNISVSKGSSITFGPTSSGNGTWAWHGPNNRYFMGREFSISNIQFEDEGVYTCYFLDAFNNVSTKEFVVEVTADTNSAKALLKLSLDRAKAANYEELDGYPFFQFYNNTVQKVYDSQSYPVETIIIYSNNLLKQIDTIISKNLSTSTNYNSVIKNTIQDWEGTDFNESNDESFSFTNQTFTINRTIDKLENGHYIVGLQGFYRNGANDGGANFRKGIDSIHAFLIANDISTPVKSLYQNSYQGERNKNGYCDTTEDANHIFQQNPWTYTNWIVTKVDNQKLILQLKKTRDIDDDWLCMGNLRLYKLNSSITSTMSPTVDINSLNGHVYSIDGRYYGSGNIKELELLKGIYIVNGKKIIIQ